MTQNCGTAQWAAASADLAVHASAATVAGTATRTGNAVATGAAMTTGAAITTGAAMTTGVAGGSASSDRLVPRARITGRPALYLLASLVVSLLAGSAAPTPLYAIYQRQWGFTPITTTIVFGVYAVAVLAALLALGRLSDSIGRRPVLLAALGVQVLSMLVFATAGGVGELLAARVIQGLATGAALGAIGAGMLDVDRERGTLANALSPGLGTGSGALVSALFVQFLPAPTHLIYFALIGVFAAQAIGVTLLRETVTRAPVTATAFMPEVRLPRAVRGPVLAAAPVLFAVWALAGLYAALGPALVQTLTGSASVVLGAASLTVLTVTAVSAVYLLRNVYARTVLVAGITALVVGVAITLIALGAGSVGLFFAGTAISGIGFGAGFQGGIRTVVPQAAPHERAGVLSLLFVISYLGMGVPAVAAGFGATDGLGLLGSARDYGIALIVLAGIALVGLRRTR
jgi:MFS family permease